MCFQRSLQELFDIGQQAWIKISAWKSSTHTDISKASNASLKVVFEPFAWQHSGCSLSLIVVKSESAVNKKQESETKTTQLLCLFYWRQNICLHLLPVWLYAKPFSFHPCWYLHLLAQHRKEALNHKKKKKNVHMFAFSPPTFFRSSWSILTMASSFVTFLSSPMWPSLWKRKKHIPIIGLNTLSNREWKILFSYVQSWPQSLVQSHNRTVFFI